MSLFTDIRRLFMLSCEDVNDFIVEYLDGTLDDRTRRRFEKHIANCPACSTYLDQYRETVTLVKEEADADVPEPPEELVDATLDFLRQHYDDAAKNGAS
ncbi:MAG: hypothetical protein GVY18_14865 [Bacteroidetes bacterium]|jgi:anti-sigma factor RsiW|nr:hypothetical protein [Bacteroidota bacterium]